MNQNLKKLITTSLLIAIGFIFRQLIPAIGTMKLDGLMAVIIVILLINPDFKNVLLTGLVTGIIAAMTTVFPGGQLPIFLDKVISCLILYAMIRLSGRYASNLIVVGVIGFIGTVISGWVFLNGVMLLASLPAPFMVLFTGIVLPAALINIPLTVIVFKAVNLAGRVTKSQVLAPAE